MGMHGAIAGDGPEAKQQYTRRVASTDASTVQATVWQPPNSRIVLEIKLLGIANDGTVLAQRWVQQTFVRVATEPGGGTTVDVTLAITDAGTLEFATDTDGYIYIKTKADTGYMAGAAGSTGRSVDFTLLVHHVTAERTTPWAA